MRRTLRVRLSVRLSVRPVIVAIGHVFSDLVYIIRFRCLRPGDADVALICVLKSYIFGRYVTDCEVSRLVFCYLLLVRRVCRI